MATSYAKHGFNDLTYARLLEYTSSPAVVLRLIHGYASNLLQGWASGRNMFITLRDAAGNIEVCKITDIQGDNLTVSRGQDGTVAQNWPAGTLITQRSVSESLGRVMQKGEYRTIAYNPNGVLAREYPNEKVYQSGDDCHRRWWIHAVDNKWRLAAGTICDGEYYDGDGSGDGYIKAPTFWEPWDAAICTYNTWDYIVFWNHVDGPVEENCDISVPPFPAGLWDLSGGSLKFDWQNDHAVQLVDTAMRTWNPGTVNNITKCLIGITATATYGSVNPDTATYLRLLINATGGGGYFTIACLDDCTNFIGPGLFEIDLATYGISGNLDSLALTARVGKGGARIEYECFYIGFY